MKWIYLALVLALFAVGCEQKNSTFVPCAPREEKKQDGPAQDPPKFPQPPSDNVHFMKGYWDGYYGRVAVLRRMHEDYREGFYLGQSDRELGIHRFTP